MTPIFSHRERNEVRHFHDLIPDLPETLPYDMRGEMNWVDFSTPVNPL